MSTPPKKIAALRVERRELATLKPHPRNPREHAEPGSPEWDALKASLERDYFDPLVVNTRNERLVSGHFRCKVLVALGFTHADVSVVDYDEETHVARMLAANQLLGKWIDELLSRLAGELNTAGLAAGLAGMTELDFAELIEGPTIADDTESAEQLVTDAEKLAQKWAVRSGDLFEIGAHRLLCGDCRDARAWHRLLGDRPADMVWTDPPYNVDYQGAAGGMMNDHMSAAAYDAFLTAAFGQAFQFTKPGGTIYVAHADGLGRAVRNAFHNVGWRETQCLVWVKSAFVLGRQDYHWQHEPILYGWKPGAAHYWQGGYRQATVIDDEPAKLAKLSKPELIAIIQALRNDRDTTVIREAKGKAGELHPTVKPLPLVARHIWNSSARGNVVAELCGGSGTTIIAADQTQRVAVATEIDPKFCAVILERASLAGLSTARLPS